MRGFRLGSILGFAIRIDYSWFILFFLILWTLGFGVFPAAYRGLGRGVYFAMGATATVLLFASLVAHELSHSLVARRKGIPVEGITLFIFGGMAHTRMEMESPGDEFQIAVVGPLSSLLLGALFFGLAALGAALGWSVAITGVARYLAAINVILALFNLLPGFPLDGGRLFRALIWRRTGDLRKATRYAAGGGKLVGYTLIALGILNLFGGNPVGGLWLVFIGWFIRTAAEASYAQMRLRQSLAGVRAAQLMTPDPQTVPVDITLRELVDEHVLRGRHQSYPVVHETRARGIVTLERIRKFPREEWEQRTVEEAMAPADDSSMVQQNEPMDRVLEKLSRSPTRRVLVLKGEDLVGILSQSDVASWMQRSQLAGEE